MQTDVKVKAIVPEQEQRTLRDYAGLVLRGMAMGASDIVPGVSGGTMAFILGIYEELIQSIRDVAQPPFVRALLQRRWREALQILNWPFLTAVAGGILLAILSMASGLEWLLENQPVLLWSFFFGLVLASVVTVSKRVSNWTVPLYVALALGAAGAFILVGLVPVQTPTSWWFLFLSGALAICAMILPGISGAFILVLLGKYEYVLNAVNQRDILTIGLIGVGAVVGLVTFAQILGWLFKRYQNATIAVLTGLMLGSLRKVWPWKLDVDWVRDRAGQLVLDSHGEQIVAVQKNIVPQLTINNQFNWEVLFAVGLALLGFVIVFLLDWLASRSTAQTKVR